MNVRKVKAARAGDKAAFSDLIRECTPGLYKAARAILNNDSDCADAMQDAILTAWEKLDQLKTDEYFRTWLTRILIRACYRIREEHQRMSVQEDFAEEAAFDTGYMDFEWQDILARLKEEHRIVIILYYAEGYKISEIAQILGLNENTVKSRLKAARAAYEQQIR